MQRFREFMLPFLALGLTSQMVYGDMLRLRDGTEVRGTILTKEGTGPLTIKKLSGEEVNYEPEQVKFTVRRPVIQEEYLSRLERMPESLEAHLKMADWCRQMDLKQERQVHLKRVLDFDPQHLAAHRGLNHLQSNGEWITPEEMMARQGFVTYHGKYFAPQEFALAEHFEHQKDAQTDWQKKVSQWQKGLAGERPDVAMASLGRIHDPNAIPALVNTFQGVPNLDQRRMLVTILSRIPSPEATFGLVMQSLIDTSDEIRKMAFASIPAESKEDATYWYVRALKHPLNSVVNRAAESIGELDGRSATLPLVEALTTLHLDPRPQKSGCGSVALCPMCLPARRIVWDRNGTVPLGYGFPAANAPSGNYIPVNWDGTARLTPVKMSEEISVKGLIKKDNPTVLKVLKEFSHQDFGYEKNAWRKWWAAEHPQSIVLAP